MEDRIWERIVAALPPPAKGPRFSHADRAVLMVGLWAVLHDRPVCWACDPAAGGADRSPRSRGRRKAPSAAGSGR